MKPAKKTSLYAAYIIGITVFFLYYLFPSDTVKTYLAYRLSQAIPDAKVNIGSLSPVLPPGIKLYDVDIAIQDTELINFEDLKITPGLLSLFSSKTNVNFKGQLYDGAVRIRAEIGDSDQMRSVTIDGKISGVQLQEIGSLQRVSDHKISGDMGGEFVYTNAGPNRSLTVTLGMSDFLVELEAPVFNQKSLGFKTVAADLALNNNTLNVRQCSARGNQMDVDIKGTIALAGVPSNNALNLVGSMTPHHVLLAKIEKSLPLDMLRKNKPGNSPISFKIRGTMEKPDFSFN